MPRTRAASGCLLAFPLALFAGSLVGSAPIVMVAPPAIPTRWSASVLQVTGKRGKGKGERESEPEPCCLSREVWGRGSQNHAANRAASPLHSVMSAGGELLHSGIDVGLAIGQEHYDADSRSSRRRYFEIKHDFDLKMSRLDRRCGQWNKLVSTRTCPKGGLVCP